jgi:Tol biopolymer transport system component
MDRAARNLLALFLALLLGAPVLTPSHANAVPAIHNPDLWVVGADGNGRRLLVSSDERPGGAQSAAWSPDGTQIAFTSGSAIWTIDPEGGEPRRVAEGSFMFVAWSPTGEWLALFRWTEDAWLLELIRPDGTDLRELGSAPQPTPLVWAPDGSKLAYRGPFEPSSVRPLTVVDVPSGESSRLATDVGYSPPTWSPDSSQIAYVDSSNRLTVVGLDKTAAKITGAYGSPDWSPDGSLIAFIDGGDINVIQPDGTGRRVLADDGQDPKWSPDSSEVAFLRGTWVLAIGRDGTGLRALASAQGSLLGPHEWSPDGTRIFYLVRRINYQPPEEYASSVGLRATGHLTLRGRARDEGEMCGSRRIIVQRRTPSGWKRMKKVVTDYDGRFETKIKDRPGRYRVRVKKTVNFFGRQVTCHAATSRVVRHRH